MKIIESVKYMYSRIGSSSNKNHWVMVILTLQIICKIMKLISMFIQFELLCSLYILIFTITTRYSKHTFIFVRKYLIC
jgi:hypothetical protein